jgi:hypothetical protein
MPYQAQFAQAQRLAAALSLNVATDGCIAQMDLDAVNVRSECFHTEHAFHVITRGAAGSDIADLVAQLVVLAI